MRAFAAIAVLAAVALSACSGDGSATEPSETPGGSIDDITVVQSETLAPDIEAELGLTYHEEQTKVLWEGEGERLQEDQPLLLDVYGESLDTGEVLQNTFDGSPASFLMAPEIIGEAMYEVLREVRVGGRVLIVSPPGSDADEAEPIALVVDVLPARASGEPQEPVQGMPTVTENSLGEPVVSVSGTELTGDLRVSTLISGDGPQVRPESQVLANYTIVYAEDSPEDEENGIEAGSEWKAGDVFDSSWPVEREPLLISMDEVSAVPGLQQGLLDQTEGSRVVIVVPPSLGYPDRGSMVFVVDILDVWNPEA